jgi:hypothetical protein
LVSSWKPFLDELIPEAWKLAAAAASGASNSAASISIVNYSMSLKPLVPLFCD